MNETLFITVSSRKELSALIGMYTGQPNMDNVLMLLAWTVVCELTLYQLYSVILVYPFLIPIHSLLIASYNVVHRCVVTIGICGYE